MTLRIRLLGDFSLQYDGVELYDVHRIRLRSFLAYLAMHTTAPLLRRQVAFTFWPDSPEGQARNNLRKILYDLRQALPPIELLLHSDANTIHWRPNAPVTLDVAMFDVLLQQADNTDPSEFQAERELLDEAVALYSGDLLPSCYDEWIVPERERLRQAYWQALTRLMQLAEDDNDYPAAIGYANRLLRHDPLQESTYRRLMRFHTFQGDRASALQVYHSAVSHLQEELGVEPGDEIQAAYARILDAEIPEKLRGEGKQVGSVARLIGREREWWRLLEAWDNAAAGTVHLCLIRGEAGVGKTRLAQELLAWVDEHGFTAAHTRAYEMAGALAYTPVIDWLHTPPLQAALQTLDNARLSEISRLLPDLLVARPEIPRPEPLDERWQRQRLYDALAQAFLACRQPLLLVLDDGQWCDPDTLEWVHYLLDHSLRRAQTTGGSHRQPALFIVCTVRGEEVDAGHPIRTVSSAFGRAERLTEIELSPFDSTETRQLAAQISHTGLDDENAADLYAFTEGNPFFIVETLASDRWKIEVRGGLSGDRLPGDILQPDSPASVALPPKLYALIQARLAQLTVSARQLAGQAVVIGRAFTFDLLRQASQLDENGAMLGVDELWRRGILREQADGRYDFSHDRIRDVTYDEISPVQRPLLHRRVAQALEARHIDDPDSISGQLGLHYQRAGDRSAAIGYFERAAEVSTALFAHGEVLSYTDRALALLDDESDTGDTVRRRIDILLHKERAIDFIYGATSAERKNIIDSVYLLSQKIDDTLYRFRVLMHMRFYYGWRGDIRKTAEITPDLLALAQSTGDPDALHAAHWEMADLYYWQGKFASALEQLKVPVANSDMNIPGNKYAPSTPYLKAILQAFLIWLLGNPTQARNQALEVVRRVDEEGQVFNQIIIYTYFCAFLQFLGDRHALRAAIAKLKERYKILVHRELMYEVTIMEGWLLAEEESLQAGLDQLATALHGMQDRGRGADLTYWLCLLAQAQRKLGQENAALDTLREAYLLGEKLGDFHWLAEIHRLTGEVQVHLGYPAVEIENSLQAALDVSRQQEAKSLELRAATSMARFWQSQGKIAEAHALLAEVYGWFTEGFDTPDLKEASALLAELTQTSA